MKKYIYTVKGLDTHDDEIKIVKLFRENIRVGVELTADASSGKICVEIDTRFSNIADVESSLKIMLERAGYELVCPPDTDKFAYNGGKPQKVKTVPLSVAVTATAITAVIAVLFTYVFASGLYKKKSSGLLTDSGYSTPIDISDPLDKLEILNEIFAQLQYDYKDLSTDELTEYLLRAYVQATGDKYAQYMNAEEYAQFISSNSGESVGIGISVTKGSISIAGEEKESINIISVSENSPAMSAGVLANDQIISIEADGKTVNVYDVGYSEAVDLLRGKEGTVVKFTVARQSKNGGSAENITFEIQRKKIVTNTVSGTVCTTDQNVGIVRITEFDLKTPLQFTNAVDSLKDKGCKYFVFDLRDNPGGDLLSISAVLSYFLSEGDVIISTEDSRGNTSTDYVKPVEYTGNRADCSVKKEDIGKYSDLEFAVLVNNNTASAAELFTATVKDYSLGTVVGVKTYGKGCMQNILPLAQYGIEGAIRVTTKMYFSKSHTVYHNIGIEPDHTIELSTEAAEIPTGLRGHDIDNQLQKAISIITNK